MERAEREREAHDVSDVLAESQRLKDRFSAVFSAPHIHRMDASWSAAIAEVRGKRILDYGCGRGELGLMLAQNGAALVEGIDITPAYVAEATAAARRLGFADDAVRFRVGDAHAMPFEDGAFDLVIGSGILHHLDLPAAMAEIRRVLRPGGVAVFKEPLVGAPWMWVFRALTPSARTPDERPLSERDLRDFDAHFNVGSRYFGLFVPPVAAALSPVPQNLRRSILKAVDTVDRTVGRLRLMRSWHQYVLLHLSRPSSDRIVEYCKDAK